MKKFWDRNKSVIFLLIIWRIALFIIEAVSPFIVPLHVGYNGPIPWANHDGIYYLRIAEFGYFSYSEAFFPFYPMVINFFWTIIPIDPWYIGCAISFASFAIGILLLHDFLYDKNKTSAWWTAVFTIAFPTSFFFTAVYSTGLFFLLSILVFISARKKQWLWCGIFGLLASATRIFGIFLFVYVILEYIASKPKNHIGRDLCLICLMPLGLVSYMMFLYVRSGDPLLFFHMQPLFGASRSGSTIILLPQVFWRYGKILFTAFLQPTPASYFITVLEVLLTMFGYGVLWWGYRMRQRWSELIYGFLAITLPTLTGTFSSMPRYLLNAFPLFLILGKLDKITLKYMLLAIFVFLQIILSAMFLRGWFVA